MTGKTLDRSRSAIVKLAVLIGQPILGFSRSLPKPRNTKASRIVQLAASLIQTTIALVYWHRVVLVHGSYFKFGYGHFQISTKHSFIRALFKLIRLQPFAVIIAPRYTKQPLSALTTKLNIRETDELDCKLAVANVLTIVGRSDNGIVHISCAFDEKALTHLQNEAAALQWLKRQSGDYEFQSLCPEVRSFDESNCIQMLTLTHVEGVFCALSEIDEREFLVCLKAAAKPLLSNYKLGNLVKNGPDHRLIAEKFSQLPALYPRYGPLLSRTLDALSNWADHKMLPSVMIHGDYHLGNILFGAHDKKVSGVIDWDRFRPEGLILLDALHLLVSSTAHRRGVHFGEVLPAIWHPEHSKGCETQYLEFLQEKTTICHLNAGMIGIVLWLNYIWLAYSERQNIDDDWVIGMVEGPASAVEEFLNKSELASPGVRR